MITNFSPMSFIVTGCKCIRFSCLCASKPKPMSIRRQAKCQSASEYLEHPLDRRGGELQVPSSGKATPMKSYSSRVSSSRMGSTLRCCSSSANTLSKRFLNFLKSFSEAGLSKGHCYMASQLGDESSHRHNAETDFFKMTEENVQLHD